MTAPTVPATDRQMAFLRKLCAERSIDLKTHLVDHGISEVTWSGGPVATMPSKAQASELISALLGAGAGGAPRSTGHYASQRRYGRRYAGAYSTSRRGRCEDAPCCGCCS